MGPKSRTVKFYSTVSDRSEIVHLIARLFNSDGGPGSGNFGHKGRPGLVGGSGAGGGTKGASGGPESSSSVFGIKAEPEKKPAKRIKIDPENENMVIVPINRKETAASEMSVTGRIRKAALNKLREEEAQMQEAIKNFGEKKAYVNALNSIQRKIKEIEGAEETPEMVENLLIDKQEKYELNEEKIERLEGKAVKAAYELNNAYNAYNLEKTPENSAKVKECLNRRDNLYDELKKARNENMKIAAEKVELEKRLHELEGAKIPGESPQEIYESINSIEGDIDAKQKEWDGVTNKIRELNKKKEKLIYKMVNESPESEEERIKIVEEYDKVCAKVNSLKEKSDKLDDEINDLTNKRDSLERTEPLESVEKRLNDKQEKLAEANRTFNEINAKMNDMKAVVDQGKVREQLGLLKKEEIKDLKKFEKEYEEIKEKWYEARNNRNEFERQVDKLNLKRKELSRAKELQEIAESGKSVADWHREKAKEEFGYTDDYNEAGWILPDGNMLNFSGEKDYHSGHRGYDHREIARVFPEAGTYGSREMREFRNEGNIRLYPEIPGINVSANPDGLTEEQYDAIRDIIDRVNDEGRGQFCIDFSNSDGDMYGQLSYTTDPEYDDNNAQYTGRYIDADEVIKDLKNHMNTGEITEEFGRGTWSGDKMPDQVAQDGGPGSGNFGHKGRPGQVGGSGPGGGKQYRVQNAKGKYEGIQKAKAFKSIAKQARAAKDVDAFVDSLSREQYDQFIGQYHSSGTKEDIWDYTERVMNLMKKQNIKPQKFQGIVEGKDISESYTRFYPEHDKRVDPKTGQVIDEEIENVMEKQGFLGFPKVVSQEEFDKIIKEHPEMPILYRSYVGATPEQTQDYDDQLEGGEWYVDCSKGGAGFGQGMYCAGVYQKDPLYKWDDPNLDDDFKEGRAELVVFTDKDGNGFVTKEEVKPEENGDLYTQTPYIFVKNDGSRQMLQMDENGIWEDMNTGSWIHEDEVDNLIKESAVYECKEQDLGIYRDAYTKEREEGIKGALDEMAHYRSLGIKRVREEAKPEPPEGMSMASSGVGSDKTYYWYDPSKAVSFTESLPSEGDVVVVLNKTDNDDYKYEKRAFEVRKGIFDGREGTLLSPLDKADYMATSFVEDFENDPDYSWTKISGECSEPYLDPTPSTRVMTLDPSAKIITYSDLQEIRRKGDYIRREFRDRQEKELNEYVKDLPFEDAWCESNIYYVSMGQGMGHKTDEQIKKLVAYKKAHPDRMAKLQDFVDKQVRAENEMKEEAGKYDHLSYLDEGIVATLLGYDAINSEGHGASDSYTVVLNRTKLIISEQRVDLRR